jgi:predicted nucleic acid-binding protein
LKRSPSRLMIMDACVLIDYLKTERFVLELFAKYLGPVHVVSPVVEEVKEIDSPDELIKLGLVIIEPEIEDAFAAASQIGPTSFQDMLCLLTAKRHGFTCVTNDKNLRKLCIQERVPLVWGLELLAELHNSGGIPGKDAEGIAQMIRKSNRKHITAKIISRFTEIIRRQENQAESV